MDLDRRTALKGIGSLAATAALGRLDLAMPTSIELPRKSDFDLRDGHTFLNAAYTHPIPRPAADAVRAYLDQRNRLTQPRDGSGGGDAAMPHPKKLFAQLINAKPSEIAYVPNTSTGENLVVNALGLDRPLAAKRNVVTDWLHFDGALVHLLELETGGLDVRVVKPTKEFRIDIHDLDRVIDKDTLLVELSSTTMYNGFQHDLKAVCELVHSRGGYVYADIIHSAGAEPFDVRASGVDFAACSSFKWLMGDYGLGFLYIKEELLDRLARSQVGYYQTADMTFDVDADPPVAWQFRKDATGRFEVGSIGGSHVAGLAASLSYVLELDPARIQAYRQPLLRKLRAEMPRLGFTCVTPPESTAGIITFARPGLGASDIPAKLRRAKVDVRVADNWLRVSPSVYNDMADVDRLLAALS